MLLTQSVAELYHCGPEIGRTEALVAAAEAAALAVGAIILDRTVVTYVPHGATVALFLAESHLVLTTWPEHALLLVDVLLCNPEMSHQAVIDEIAARLCPDGEKVIHHIPRYIGARPGRID